MRRSYWCIYFHHILKKVTVGKFHLLVEKIQASSRVICNEPFYVPRMQVKTAVTVTKLHNIMRVHFGDCHKD